MDTIEISIPIDTRLSMEIIESFRDEVNNLKSPNGFTFCDVLEISKVGNAVIKISYPRFYYGNNAYLIDSRIACLEVQRYFADNILNGHWQNSLGDLKLTRVDIPFTYHMESSEDFNSYINIFTVFSYVYYQMKGKARPKYYGDMLSKNIETIKYSDNGKVDKSSNNSLMIYNQWVNLQNKLGEEILEEAINTYPDLPQRIRMEVSKRKNLRRSFNSNEFASLDILGSHFEEYKKYILGNVLNLEVIDSLYNEWSMNLNQELIKFRDMYGKINYRQFILTNLNNIYDYEILRRALKLTFDNVKSRENAVTTVRKIFNEIQCQRNIIIIDTYNVLLKMRDWIINYQLVD